MGFLGLMLIPISRYYMFKISAECGYHILMTKICNGAGNFHFNKMYAKHQCTEQ